MSITGMAANSAIRSGFFGGLSEGVGKTIARNVGVRPGLVRSASGIGGKISAGMNQAWTGTGGNTIKGIRMMKNNWANPRLRGYGAGMAIGGLGTAWVGMAPLNIIRPGDNVGLF